MQPRGWRNGGGPMAKRVSEDDRKLGALKGARWRLNRCVGWEADYRPKFIDDVKFVEGDSDNLYQWPDQVRTRMEDNNRALLPINKTKQHSLDVMNDARQSRVAIKIRATGGGGSSASAQVFAGVVRHIEYISNAATAYQHGLSFAVRGGIGYWRGVNDYANDDHLHHEIFF